MRSAELRNTRSSSPAVREAMRLAVAGMSWSMMLPVDGPKGSTNFNDCASCGRSLTIALTGICTGAPTPGLPCRIMLNDFLLNRTSPCCRTPSRPSTSFAHPGIFTVMYRSRPTVEVVPSGKVMMSPSFCVELISLPNSSVTMPARSGAAHTCARRAA